MRGFGNLVWYAVYAKDGSVRISTFGRTIRPCTLPRSGGGGGPLRLVAQHRQRYAREILGDAGERRKNVCASYCT